MTFFGCGGHPPDLGDAETLRIAPAELDRLRFLVDGPDLGDVRRQRESNLAGAAGEVEQSAAAAERHLRSQIVEQRHRYGGRNRS
jgi:hypothetical protein